MVGEVEELIDKAKEISQRTLRWYRFCQIFKQELGRQRRIIFAAFAAGGVGFGIVLVLEMGRI